MWVLVVAAGLAAYVGVYLRVVSKYGEPASKRFVCCWADLYRGKAFWAYNVLFSPAILLIHSVRIFLGSCLSVYGRRLFWRAFGVCTSFFTDAEFPPEERSLGNVGGDFANAEAGRSDSKIVWVRAMDFSKFDLRQRDRHPQLHNTQMCLFEGEIEAKDILQGALGDCWLLAAMATLAEHEGAIRSLFLTPEVDPRGKYYVRLFDPQQDKWKTLVLDDFVPCQADPAAADGVRRGPLGEPEAAYAHPHGREIWAVMLEKAFAKLCGGYAAIEAGITEWGIVCMTGGGAWRYEVQGTVWRRSDLVIQQDPRDKRACGFRPCEEQHNTHEMFDLIRHYKRQGAVLCCGGVTAEGQKWGLVQKHAFSLLQVRTARVNAHSDDYFRFVQVRNPWGTGEWKGPWSDSSSQWESYPHVKHELNFQCGDDGAFWMQWEDFQKYWGYVGVVDCTTDIHSLTPPPYRESEPLGPAKAFVHGCGRYWCMCSGLWHLLMSHDATAQKILSPKDFQGACDDSCGVDASGPYCRVLEQNRVHVDPAGQLVRGGLTPGADGAGARSLEKSFLPPGDR